MPDPYRPTPMESEGPTPAEPQPQSDVARLTLELRRVTEERDRLLGIIEAQSWWLEERAEQAEALLAEPGDEWHNRQYVARLRQMATSLADQGGRVKREGGDA